MFQYNICNVADANLFHKQCRVLERRIPNLKAESLLQDVDDSLIQVYHHPLGTLTVRNDMQVGALYIEAEFDIDPFFN